MLQLLFVIALSRCKERSDRVQVASMYLERSDSSWEYIFLQASSSFEVESRLKCVIIDTRVRVFVLANLIAILEIKDALTKHIYFYLHNLSI